MNANKEQLIGKTVLEKFGANLPFLPKILSIQKALPLQIHPDIELSKKLHKQDPEKYSDTNHKPEIAIALSDFEAFCGFKPKADIQHLLKFECLQQFDPQPGKWTNDTTREVCKALLTADEKTVASTLAALKKISKPDLGNQAYIQDLIPQLVDQYGSSDNGNLVALVLMNFLTFKPGEAIWIPADGIHAYLRGDIVECMARSNNVINAGFAPKSERDPVDLFVNALTFQQHDAKKPLLPKQKCEHTSTGKSHMFHPPMDEFSMIVTELQSGETDSLKGVKGPSIAFTTSGKGTMKADGKSYDASPGAIFFIGQGVEVSYESSADDFKVFRAYAE